MRPKKPAIDVRSERSTMLIQHNKVKKSNIEKKEEKFLYSEKTCQADKNSVTWSVTKEEIQMCGYPNQQGYVETRTVNLQDVIRI